MSASRMSASRARELVVVVAGTSWDGMWMAERHVAMHLSRSIPVLWVDPPISWMTPLHNPAMRGQLLGPKLRRAAPGIIRLTPVTVPGVTRPVLREVAGAQVGRGIRAALIRLNARARAVIVPTLADQLAAVPGAPSIFYGKDDYVAGAELMGVDRGWLERAERRQLREADTVVAVSEVLREKWSVHRPDIHVIPNGCDVAYFAGTDSAPMPTDVHLPQPIAGFVGHMSERIDLSCLEAVADRGVSVLLVGPCQPTFKIRRMEALFARPNVAWVGPKPFTDLASYMRVIDVGMTPYADSAFNQASFPLKTLEYLAAGRAAVVTDLPSNRMLDTDLITVAGTPEAFADATVAALSAGRTPAEVAARRSYAASYSWASRVEQVADLIGLAGR